MITLPPLCSRVQWMQETRTFPSQSFQWYVHYTLALALSCYAQFVCVVHTFYACAVYVHVRCMYMSSVCTCAVYVHVQLCVQQSFLCSFPVAPHTPHTPLSCMQLDCFHPSLLMHELMAKVMWNCMLTPAMQKDRTFNARADFICPNNSTLLYTY